MLGHVWQRLADLLVAHTRAEEQTCYADGPAARAAGWMRDPVAGHEDIRKFIGEAAKHPVGSAPWWHAVTWWEAFGQAGHVVPMAEIHRAIGMGSGLLLDKLLPADRDKDADADIRTAHSALYSTYWSRLRPLPGAADLLRACQRRGLAVVLASSADEPEFNALRAALDAEDAIDAATFSGDVESSKPAPDGSR